MDEASAFDVRATAHVTESEPLLIFNLGKQPAPEAVGLQIRKRIDGSTDNRCGLCKIEQQGGAF